jgi:hypothetical protein
MVESLDNRDKGHQGPHHPRAQPSLARALKDRILSALGPAAGFVAYLQILGGRYRVPGLVLLLAALLYILAFWWFAVRTF